MQQFDTFCTELELSELSKTEQAVSFLWFHCRTNAVNEGTISDVAKLFHRAKLPAPNASRLKEDFRKSKEVHKGETNGAFRVARTVHDRLESQFGRIFSSDKIPTVAERAELHLAPFLTEADRSQAKKMAELYVVLHCYENSARHLIEKVLSKKLGVMWWDTAASVPMKTKVHDRRGKETKNRWVGSRGTSPLFYVDWGDLLTLIRKYEADFSPHIGDFKFVELRFEELERFRNVVAHHGALPSEDDFHAVILSFKQWCRQVSTSP